MSNNTLSIIIPARQEEFLTGTVEHLLKSIRGKTEIIVGCDGNWPDPPMRDHPDVTIIYYPESIGQRAIMNRCVKLSRAKYILKSDAHCLFDEGFDVKLMADMKPDWTVTPLMKNLHMFDWVCKKCGERRYQGPEGPCKKCGGKTVKDIVWIAKKSPNSTSYRFNKELRFQYFGEYKKKQKGDIVDTMSLQGSCFMCTREKYWELELCDESWGSWGQQGSEVSLKGRLAGGKVKVNKKTWYAHMFRTQSGFNWPYPAPGRSQAKARKICKDIFLNNKWDKQIYPLSSILKKFWPIPDWEQKDLDELIAREKKQGWHKPNKGIIFYTHNKLNIKIAHAVQKQLRKVSKETGIPIVSASLKPMPHFGDKNIHVKLSKGYLAYFTQIFEALEASTANIIFFTEHDCLYNTSCFDFIPPRKDKFYYNRNFWKLRIEDGHALHYEADQVSGLCAYRELLLDEYGKRLEIVKKDGYNRNMGHEPGTHDGRAEWWKSRRPLVDIRHGNNLSKSRWSKSQFRNKDTCKGWREADRIPYLGETKDILKLF